MGNKGYNAHFHAAVVAVADVYDAITSTRSYSTRSSYVAAEILWQESFGRLDPALLKYFMIKSLIFILAMKFYYQIMKLAWLSLLTLLNLPGQ